MRLQLKLVYLFGATALLPLLLATAQAIEVAGTLFVDLQCHRWYGRRAHPG